MLLRFLREHRSEWADSNIDGYSAASVKAIPHTLPISLTGCSGGQVILPLAHTLEHEEVVNRTSLILLCWMINVSTLPIITAPQLAL